MVLSIEVHSCVVCVISCHLVPTGGMAQVGVEVSSCVILCHLVLSCVILCHLMLFCVILWDLSEHRIRLYPIRSPTVAKGEERVRIIVHAHNLISEIDYLLLLIQSTLVKMGLLSLQISHAKL